MNTEVTIINNDDNKSINLEIEAYQTDVEVSFRQSNEAALAVHNGASNVHANIINPITSDINSINNEISTINTGLATKAASSDVTTQLATKANASSTYTKTEVDTALAAKVNTSDTTVTKQGNTFNGVNQLLQLDTNGKLPAVDGSNLTAVPTTVANTSLSNLTTSGKALITSQIVPDYANGASKSINTWYTASKDCVICATLSGGTSGRQSGIQIKDGSGNYIPCNSNLSGIVSYAQDFVTNSGCYIAFWVLVPKNFSYQVQMASGWYANASAYEYQLKGAS